MRTLVPDFFRRLRALPPRTRRSGLVAACAALTILALTAGLLLANSAQHAPPAAQAAIVTGPATDGATLPPSPTASHLRPTPTKTRVVQAPPRPNVPTPPPATPPATPTATFCSTPTPLPSPSPTPSPSSAQPALFAQAQATCVPCPYYSGNNPSQPAIRAALNSAADAYHLPRNLLLAVAWQESRWHEDVLSCDGGIGLMQLQYYTCY